MLSTVQRDQWQVVLGAHLGDQRVMDVAAEIELDSAGKDRRDGGRRRRQNGPRAVGQWAYDGRGCRRRLSERATQLGERLGDHDRRQPNVRDQVAAAECVV